MQPSLFESPSILFEAASDHRKWSEVLELMQQTTGSVGATLSLPAEKVSFNLGVSGCLQESYNNNFGHLDRIGRYAAGVEDFADSSCQLCQDHPDLLCDDYEAAVQRFGVRDRWGMRLGEQGFLALHHSERFSARMLARLANDAVQIRLAYRAFQHSSRQSRLLNQMLTCASETGVGVAVLDEDARLEALNDAAGRAITNHSVLQLRRGRVSAGSMVDQRSLHAQIENISSRPELLDFGRQVTTDDVQVVAVARADGEQGCILLFTEPMAPVELDTQLLSKRYGFTKTESEILAMVAKNLELPDIARVRGTTEETTRGQIKTIRRKTGARNRAELLQLCATTVGRFVTAGCQDPECKATV